MSLYIQMAGINVHIDGWKTFGLPEKNFQAFYTDKPELYSHSDKISILIQEVENGAKECTEYRKFGHVENAVRFDYRDWKKEKITFQINPDCYKEEAWNLTQLFSLAGIHSLFLNRGGILLHASYIIVDGKAVLFTAPSQTGKSTQAELWRKYGKAEIVNGDRVVLRKRENQWYAHGVPMCGSSDICKNISAKIKSIVVLEQGDINRVCPMSTIEKYKALYLGSQHYLWDKEESQLIHEIVSEITGTVDIIKLSCTPDRQAVEVLKDYFERNK